MAPCVYGSMHIQLHAFTAPCIYSSAHIQCSPLAPSSLPSLPAHSPHSSSLPACSPISSLLPAHPLAPCHPEVVGIPIHTKLFIGHWEPAGSELEGAGASWEWGKFQGPRDAQGARGASLKWAGGLLRSQGLEMLRGQGEQAGSKGSKLGARGASWKWGEWAGGFLRPQENSRDPGMLREQGEQAGSKGSELAPQVYGSMCIWLHAYTARRIYGTGGAKESERATWWKFHCLIFSPM